MSKHDTYVAELIRLDGCGEYASGICRGCHAHAQFQCLDCDDLQLYCCECTVTNHVRSPTHQIQEWIGKFFQGMSLKMFGLQVQLGHPASQNYTNRIHEVGLDFCGCETSNTHIRQLLCHGWFPSTLIDPRTAATFQLLRHFQILSFESKASTYEFYHSLVHLTDNTGLTKPKDHYNTFIGVEGTLQGKCVVICLACPQPGINLPNGWEHATKDKQWLYTTFVTIDVNFCLKRCNVSTDHANPSLSKGWSYFVEEADYKSYLAEHLGEAQEKSTCSSHNAVNMVDTKLSQGLAATGVGMVNYTHHNIKRGNGVGDLQKGEKYINMDYLFFSMLNYVSKIIHFFIPKFHLPAHIAKCQSIFSFNFTCFIGRTDGEAQKEVGCHRDTLDDHFGDWNWKKVVGLGALLLNKMKDALVERAEHQAAFDEFDAVISIEHHATWLSEMEVWEQNPNDTMIPNPLETKAITITQAGAQLRLAKLEAHKLEHGVDVSLHPEVSPSVLIVSGLDLEEEQRHLKSLVKSMGVHIMDTQWGSLVRMWNLLCHKIETWGHVQVLYMPAHLQNNEWELRYAQAHDALEELRQCLHIHCSLLTFKCTNMRAQNALTCIHGWRTACIKCYRSAWTALKFLAMLLKKMDWKGRLHELADEHIKPLVDLFGVWEGRRQVSWIWMMEGIDCNGQDCDDDGVHIKWCKSRARALQWTEEVELLTEEMERVIWFFHWDAQCWEEQRSQFTGESPAHTEGLQAYAARQADIRHRLAGHFCVLWAPYLMPTLSPGIDTTPPFLHAELSLPDLTMPVMDTDDFCDDHA
ncbi:uncharacterized protein HD556DRAFT_1433970 [Suillus plorans]|uniref:CxC2-like cysteine cluster KDZ transposase-associated domain-containing protein n=1 Tax=Suillus plorans TaxID=116603 RepID=A0A9P7DCR0_9AGAM|nr:uncharacterized protein HD556DRAFT_1433970 [Suillus plorans]KAG1788775.1 hypothetical protein HD556DRAFT_1433970 [Suillus plorans]